MISLSVSYEVLSRIVTLQQEMAAYSPLGEDGKENEKLAFLPADVWQEADRQGNAQRQNPGPGSHDVRHLSRRGWSRPGAGGNER